jgi:hypothetical protein
MTTLARTGQEYIDSLNAEAVILREKAAAHNPNRAAYRQLITEAYTTERIVWVLESLWIGSDMKTAVSFKEIGECPE